MNILSYNSQLLGSEIKEWITYHTTHDTEYSRYAKRMSRFMNIHDDRIYIVKTITAGSGCGELNAGYPIVIRKA